MLVDTLAYPSSYQQQSASLFFCSWNLSVVMMIVVGTSQVQTLGIPPKEDFFLLSSKSFPLPISQFSMVYKKVTVKIGRKTELSHICNFLLFAGLMTNAYSSYIHA
ncbi:unnamed protein product [Absidia cylindrospora]